MNQLKKRKHTVTYLKNYPFYILFLKQLCVFFPFNSYQYSVHKNIKVRIRYCKKINCL